MAAPPTEAASTSSAAPAGVRRLRVTRARANASRTHPAAQSRAARAAARRSPSLTMHRSPRSRHGTTRAARLSSGNGLRKVGFGSCLRPTRPTRLLLARPRGYCAGVERAVEAVEQMLEVHGPPIYVRKQIVHNIHVVRRLEQQGAIFVESEDDVPEGATIVLSAHGVAPEVHRNAAARRLHAIDATCPLVTKVHNEARRFAAQGFTIFLIGHAGHEEVVGTMGEAPDAIELVQTLEDVARLSEPRTEQLAYITQTTLSVDETADIIAALQERFPTIVGPPKDDICYATTNRQAAVKSLAREVDLVLVIGSANSSNSQRLVDVTRDLGVPAHLIDDESQILDSWLEGVETVGITSGASAPEWLVERVVGWFRERGVEQVAEHHLIEENVHFALPRGVREAQAATG